MFIRQGLPGVVIQPTSIALFNDQGIIANLLQPFAVLFHKTGTQAFMPLDHRIQSPQQPRHIQHPVQFKCGDQVVGGVVRLQLMNGPQTLLCWRQRDTIRAVTGDNRQAFEGNALFPQLL